MNRKRRETPLRPLATAAAGALCALLLATPAPAAARVTISVEVAYGGVLVGGVGFFLYLGASWDVPLAMRDLPTSLLEIGPGRTRLGVPLPRLDADPDDAPARPEVSFDLLRWRF